MKYWHPLLILGTQFIVFVCLYCLFNTAIKLYPAKSNHESYIHRTIYIDRRFNIDEALLIQKAAERWTKATRHIAELDAVVMPAEISDQEHSHSIIILDVTPDFPPVIEVDRLNQQSTCGLYNAQEMAYPTVLVVKERIENSKIFEEVIMHEIGHALGLHHLNGDENILTLMYPAITVMSNGITIKDLIMFCDIYHCDPNQLTPED